MTSEPRSRRLIRGLAALSALTLLAAACGDDDAADEDASSSTDSVGTTEPEAATTEAPTVTVAAVTDTTEAAAVTTAGTETSAPAGISEADWDAIVTAAQDEGKVTIYSSQGLDQLNDMAERFSDEYGIELEVVRDIDSALIPKVEAEQQTGSGIADVIAQASAAWSNNEVPRAGSSRPVGPGLRRPGLRPGRQRLERHGYFTSSAAVLTFGWNTDQYPNGLTDYSDLLDPELAGGRIGVIEPAAPSIVDFWLYLEENYGEDFVTQLAAQEPKIYPSSLPMAQALTSGEISAGSFVQVLVDEKDRVPRSTPAWPIRCGGRGSTPPSCRPRRTRTPPRSWPTS